MVPTQLFRFFFPKGFFTAGFSGLRSNRTSILSDWSAPLLLLLSSFVLAFFTCILLSSLLAQTVRCIWILGFAENLA